MTDLPLTWPELEQYLERQGPRDTYTVSELDAAAQELLGHSYSRRYLQDVCRRYALVLDVTLQTRIRRNFVETLLSTEQFSDMLTILYVSRETSASVNELLAHKRQQLLSGAEERDPLAIPMTPLEMATNLNRLIIETMECKERASGAEDLAIEAKQQLQRVEQKLDELLGLLRQ